MARALGVLIAALACAVAAGAGANEPIAPNELGLTAIDCATQYCTSKDSLLLWLSLENSCFSDKQPCRARVLDPSLARAPGGAHPDPARGSSGVGARSMRYVNWGRTAEGEGTK